MDYFFEVIVTYDKKAASHYTNYHYHYVDRKQPGSIMLTGIFCLIAGVIALVWGDGGYPMFLFLTVGVLLLVVGLRMFDGRTTIKLPNTPDGKPLQNRLRFFDDRFEYAGPQSQGYYRYDQVVRVGEDEFYFFVYIAKNQAFIIPKNGFTMGAADSFRQFLLVKVPPRQG